MRLFCFILFLTSPLCILAQDISGLWIGHLYNDSTQQELRYEVAISETKGKYSGYTSTIFIVDYKELIGVKSIKVNLRNGKIVFEDIELLYNNYPFEPPRGVKQLSVLDFVNGDPNKLSGRFTTTRTRQYGRPVTGTLALEKVSLGTASNLVPVIKDLGLAANVSFLPPEDKKVIAKAPAVPVVAPDPLQLLTKRKIETVQTVFFDSDSLRLELFDNGYVDGDSVSIILNGKILMQHVRLTDKPVSKTIHITKETGDSLNLVMFAENLGSIPPNSGYAVIYDGDKKYQVSFSGDMEKNAAIILKRKKRPEKQ